MACIRALPRTTRLLIVKMYTEFKLTQQEIADELSRVVFQSGKEYTKTAACQQLNALKLTRKLYKRRGAGRDPEDLMEYEYLMMRFFAELIFFDETRLDPKEDLCHRTHGRSLKGRSQCRMRWATASTLATSCRQKPRPLRGDRDGSKQFIWSALNLLINRIFSSSPLTTLLPALVQQAAGSASR